MECNLLKSSVENGSNEGHQEKLVPILRVSNVTSLELQNSFMSFCLSILWWTVSSPAGSYNFAGARSAVRSVVTPLK